MKNGKHWKIIFSATVFVAFAMIAVTALPGVFADQSVVSTTQYIVISPPQIILEEIYYLEQNTGTYASEGNVTVVSEQGTISIVNKTIGETVEITNLSTQPSPYEFKIINEVGQNTTIAFLYSSNGYVCNITNSKNQITGRVNNLTINMQNGVALLTEYPFLYTASYVSDNQISPDSTPPPPGQNYSVDYVSNHTSELLNYGSGDQITQLWFNVTLFWQYSSSGIPEVIKLWMNGTCEAPGYWLTYVLSEINLQFGFDGYMFWGGNSIDNTSYYIQVPPPAYTWAFTTANSVESSQISPFGHNIFDNDTLEYGDAPMTPNPYTDVWIPQM